MENALLHRQKPRLWKSLASRLTLSLVAALFAVILLEIVFRIAGIRGEYHREHVQQLIPRPGGPSTQALLGDVPLATYRCLYDSNPTGYFGSNNEVDHVYNSAGWRDREHTILKREPSYRVLGLGDSFLFGYGVHYEDIYFARLEGQIREELPQLRVETINTGVKGTNTVFQANLLRQRALRYNPDMVILNFVLNDIDRMVQYQGIRSAGEWNEITSSFLEPDTLSKWSNLWGWGRLRWRRLSTEGEYVDATIEGYAEDDPKWQECKSALFDIAAACRNQDIPLLVVIFPFFHHLDSDYPFQPIHENLHQFLDREGFRYLDLRETYRPFHGPELWVHPTDLHPNKLAHGIAAEAIAKYLVEHAHDFRLDAVATTSEPFDQQREAQLQAEARIVQLWGAVSEDGSVVDLSGNPLTDEDLQLLEPYWQGLPHLISLSLRQTNISNKTIDAIVSLKNLTGLDLSATRLTGPGLANLQELTNLEQLGLAQLEIDDDDLALLSSLRKLKTLNLAGTTVTNAGLAHLTKLPDIEHLVLSETSITDGAIKQIATMTKLVAVDIQGTSINPTALTELTKLRPELTVIK